MLNHFRNLLMNVSGSSPFLDHLAEELIDPAFKAVSLTTPLLQVHRVLFGAEPDRHMKNIRTRQLLALVHATPLAEYVYAMDPRVTYKFDSKQLVDPDIWKPKVSLAAGSGTCTVLGEPGDPDASGLVHHSYNIKTLAPGQATIERRTRPISKVVFEFTANSRVKLPGSGCDIRLSSEATGQEFAVDLYAKPQRDVSTLCQTLSQLGEPTLNAIFGVTAVEPWSTFRALFFRKLEVPLRLSAIVCALVYRTDLIRVAAPGTIDAAS